MASNNLPKSLHTVTVLVRMVRLLRAFPANTNASNAALVNVALRELGYSDTPDSYGLAIAAVRQLDKKG